jgi:membrane protease YdiL (CAAX protease family)
MSDMTVAAVIDKKVGAQGAATVAPAWHTLLVLLLLAGWAYCGFYRAEHMRLTADANRVALYGQTIVGQWVLFGVVFLGLWLHKAPWSVMLGKAWHNWSDFWTDCKAAIVFWLGSTAVLAIVGLALGRGTGTARVAFLLPHGALEMVMWTLLAATAGVCEEAIFRGYLQRQMLAWTRSAPVAIAVTALAFGAMHAYQGWTMMVSIGLLGAMLGVLAQWRGTLRPGMMAHALQDALAGLLTSLAKH